MRVVSSMADKLLELVMPQVTAQASFGCVLNNCGCRGPVNESVQWAYCGPQPGVPFIPRCFPLGQPCGTGF